MLTAIIYFLLICGTKLTCGRPSKAGLQTPERHDITMDSPDSVLTSSPIVNALAPHINVPRSPTNTVTPAQKSKSRLPSQPIRRPGNTPPECFKNSSHRLGPTTAEDCHTIIQLVILAYYGDPYRPKTFGYNEAVDIDLRQANNQKWIQGNCVIFVRNQDQERVDHMRMIDIAEAATDVLNECVVGTKYALGGTAGVGMLGVGFYVAVGGTPISRAVSES
ncbi:MAG: hypothetical protein Q9218_003981 [Villophora microphyllina]